MITRPGGAPNLAARKRLVWISLFVFALFCLLIVQFFRIQIIEGEKWTRQAKAQHQLVVTEPFKRGLFYSNASIKLGHPETPQAFVIDVPKFHLYSDPNSIPENCRNEVADKICALLNIRGIERKNSASNSSARPARANWPYGWIKSNAMRSISGGSTMRAPKKSSATLSSLSRITSAPILSENCLARCLHTVREEKDAKTRQSIPTGGLELVFDKILQGKEGKRLILRSPRHPMETGKILSYPEDGADVHLTINHYLQAIAEEEICKAVKNANAKGGWAVLMEPRTGEIWALAQYP